MDISDTSEEELSFDVVEDVIDELVDKICLEERRQKQQTKSKDSGCFSKKFLKILKVQKRRKLTKINCLILNIIHFHQLRIFV